MQALQNQSDARLQRPDLQRWLMQLEALRYAPPAGDSQHAEARRPNAKSPSSGADAKRRVATLQRDLTRLLPLRTP
jgi:hypothetical protein